MSAATGSRRVPPTSLNAVPFIRQFSDVRLRIPDASACGGALFPKWMIFRQSVIPCAPVLPEGMGPVNDVTLCVSETNAAQFGSQVSGFTIPQALDAIYDHGAGTVLVINVLDPVKHKTSVSNASVTFDSTGVAQLVNPVVSNLVLRKSDDAQPYVEGQDYTLDAQTGKITRVGTNIDSGSTVIASYDFADPSKVTAADIIGSVNEAGNRTGPCVLAARWDAACQSPDGR